MGGSQIRQSGRELLYNYYPPQNMSGQREAAMRQSKRAAAHISKFLYHLEHIAPECFPKEAGAQIMGAEPILKTRKGVRNTTFLYAQHSSEGVSTLDAESILLSALKVYVGPECVKLSDTSYQSAKTVKAPYLPVYGLFQEIIEFYIVDKNQNPLPVHASEWVKRSHLPGRPTNTSWPCAPPPRNPPTTSSCS